MVTESKYTSPVPRSVATVLAIKPAPTPSATGTSMPRWRCLRPRHAPAKIGEAEYNTTGKVSTRLAQRISCNWPGSMAASWV